jgi:hypothetical protein
VINVSLSDQEYVRVVQTEPESFGKWVALSHRWGVGQVFSLTTSNLQLLQTGVSVSSLSPTFRDAITITRKLGVKYLWIDSLCILQDSVDDWDVEASKIPGIYQNAYVTIAAAATNSCQGGILTGRAGVPNSRPCQVPVYRQGRSGTVTIDLPLDYNLKNPEINFLKNQAWYFQESQLSRRLLIFD